MSESRVFSALFRNLLASFGSFRHHSADLNFIPNLWLQPNTCLDDD